MNTKLHAVANAKGRPIGFFMSAGQVSDYTGAAALPGSLPKADWLLADRGYDADWLREALKDKGMKVCIPGALLQKAALRRDFPFPPGTSGDADDLGGVEGVEAVHESDADVDLGGLTVGGEPLERHWSERQWRTP